MKKIIKNFTFQAVIVCSMAIICIVIMAFRIKLKPITNKDKYLGRIKNIEFKNGGFLTSDKTIIYCDSMIMIIDLPVSVKMGAKCYLQDKEYVTIEGCSRRYLIE